MVGQDMPNKQRLAAEINFGNETKLVPGNIEHHVRAHPICTPKHLSHFRKTLPLATPRNRIPVVERSPCVRPRHYEFPDCLIADDMQNSPRINVPITGTYFQPTRA